MIRPNPSSRPIHLTLFALALVAVQGCAATEDRPTAVTDLPGARNAALRAAAERNAVPIEWLAAIAFQQGRFEPAEVGDDHAAAGTDGDAAISVVDDEEVGDAHVEAAPAWGVMYLTDAQIARASALTGTSPDRIRGEHAGNVDAAAALLADAWQHPAAGVVAGSEPAWRAAVVELLGLTDVHDAAAHALDDLDGVLRDGFDLTTSDGERLALDGSAPAARAAAVAPGQYPPSVFIASPNFSQRAVADIRYVILHDIEGTMDAAIAVFKNPAKQASAHYIVRSRDGHIVQMVREVDKAWHCGHRFYNTGSIGIEHEGFADRAGGGGFYNETMYRTSAQLTCAIVLKYDIPVDRKHIFGHYNVPKAPEARALCSDADGIRGRCGGKSGHHDPGRYWDWNKYMGLVARCVADAS